MEINIGDERIMVLHARFSAEQIREKAMAKRIEAFGMIAKLIQRVKPEDIKIATFQKRFEPFWFVVASSRYVYDRRHKYHVEVAPKVHAVTVHGNKYLVMGDLNNSFVVRKMVLQLIKTIQADAIHEEIIYISEITLFYRPVYAIEYLWKDKNKKKVVEFDALTGEAKFEDGIIMKQVTKALENNIFFDLGADAAGTLIPGANLVVKLGRMAAKKAIE